MRKEGINPLTNDGQYADTTYKRAVEKRSREMNCTPKVGHKTTFGGAVFL